MPRGICTYDSKLSTLQHCSFPSCHFSKSQRRILIIHVIEQYIYTLLAKVCVPLQQLSKHDRTSLSTYPNTTVAVRRI